MNPFDSVSKLYSATKNINLGNAVGNLVGDITPGYNLTKSAGGGVPFVQRSSVAPVAPAPQPAQKLTPQFDPVETIPTSGAYTGGSAGGGGAAAGPTAAELAQYDQAIGTYEGQLGRLPSQLGIAQGNINTQYGQSRNELTSGFNQAKNTYGQNTTQNQQQYVTNKNQINDTASSGLRGLLRTLGAYGAGGGSDQSVGANAVATGAARQRAGAGETFGQNQQQLDTSWGNYGVDYGNQEKKLEDWKNSQMQTAEQSSTSNKQSILQTLANLRAQRAGGNTAAAQAALSEANGLQSRIDSLGVMNPTYDGTTPTYTAPDVASYSVNPNAETQVNQSAADSMGSPYLQMLLGKKKQQQVQYA